MKYYKLIFTDNLNTQKDIEEYDIIERDTSNKIRATIGSNWRKPNFEYCIRCNYIHWYKNSKDYNLKEITKEEAFIEVL